MWVPGMCGLVLGALILAGVKGSPQEAGFPPVEADEPETSKKGERVAVWQVG